MTVTYFTNFQLRCSFDIQNFKLIMHAHYLNKYRDHRWRRFSDSISSKSSSYSRTLGEIKILAAFHNKLKNNNKDWLQQEIRKSGNKQQQKQQQKEVKKATSGGFPVKTFLFLFTVLGAVIYADVETSGSWKDSNTALLLKKYHVCEYSHKVINTTRDGIRWVNSEIDKQFPGYEQKLHETLEPYGEMLSDVGVISYNIASNTKNAFLVGVGTVITKIEEQAPGLVENTVDGIRTVLKNTVNFTKRSANYLKEEVFVGKLAPEHVGKVIVEALNTTQQMVNQYYVWAYEKVRTVIK